MKCIIILGSEKDADHGKKITDALERRLTKNIPKSP